MNMNKWIISIPKIAEHIMCLNVVLVSDGWEYTKNNQLLPLLLLLLLLLKAIIIIIIIIIIVIIVVIIIIFKRSKGREILSEEKRLAEEK